MITPIPDIDICRNRVSHDISVLEKAPLFRGTLYAGNLTFGKIEKFSTVVFKEGGLEFVKRSLSTFNSRSANGDSEFDALGKSAKRCFFENHQIVGISLRSNGDLWLDPVHHKVIGLSGFSDEKERKVVSVSVRNEQFFEVLSECLNLAD